MREQTIDQIEKNIDFDEIVDRTGTDCLKYDFAARRGKPQDVLPLWVADMDFKTSSRILDELHRRVEHGIFGYTETGEEYFRAVSDWYEQRHHLTLQQNWIVKTPGIVFALAMAVRAYTDEGDAVLIQQPVYYPFTEVIEDNNRVVVSNDLVLEKDGKYQIDFEDFEKKIVQHNIRLFFLCSPHNPVGRVWTKEELKKVGEICLKHKVIVISDEIHGDFTFDGYSHTPFLNVDQSFSDFTIVCTSPAKTFNLAGLQISNIIIPNAKLRRAFRRQLDAAGYSQCNTMGVIACEAAYRYGAQWFDRVRQYLQENLAFVREYVDRELPQIKLIEPEGTYLVWLDFRSLGLRGEELEELILHRAKLWLDSGAIFGKSGEGFERVNIATSRRVLKQALDQIRQALEEAGLQKAKG